MSYKSGARSGAKSDFDKTSKRLGGDRRRIKRAKDIAIRLVRARESDIRKVAALVIERQRISAQQMDWVIANDVPIPDWLS